MRLFSLVVSWKSNGSLWGRNSTKRRFGLKSPTTTHQKSSWSSRIRHSALLRTVLQYWNTVLEMMQAMEPVAWTLGHIRWTRSRDIQCIETAYLCSTITCAVCRKLPPRSLAGCSTVACLFLLKAEGCFIFLLAVGGLHLKWYRIGGLLVFPARPRVKRLALSNGTPSWRMIARVLLR
jgi:hypothetical protein